MTEQIAESMVRSGMMFIIQREALEKRSHFPHIHKQYMQDHQLNNSPSNAQRRLTVRRGTASRGFTIVELLIVIVVIAILAAISIVAYNGIQDRARQTAATSAARQLSDKAEIYFVENDSYPANLSAIGIEDSASTSYQYRFSSSSPDIYCATATSGNKSAWVSNAQKTPQDGACAGHANGGVQPEIVTNLVRNPKGLSGAVGNGFFTVTNAGNALTLNVPFGERDNWTRVRIAGATGLYRMSVQPSDLEGGESYTASVLVANPGTTTLNVFMDFCDTPGISTTLAAGEIKRISTTGARANYDSTYSFMDISTTNAGSEFLEAYS